MAAGEVRVLGPVEVVADDRVIPLAGKQTKLLAALLVADGKTLGADELVDAVWDGSAPASARKLVQVYVSQLRKVLPAGIEIETRAGGYVAAVETSGLDASRFEQLLRESIAAREAGNPALALSLADRSASLWRGRAYGELAYEDFARTESERLEELRLAAVEERLAAQLELGRAAEVLGDVLAHAEESAFRERAHELAMLALYRCGRQAEALERYAAFRAQLDDELGLQPGDRLRELQRRILQQDPELDVSSDAPTGSTIPLPPNPLVGRERELAALRSLLERGDSRLVVLTGAGGSGKTRLALEVARELAGSFANGALFVELAPLRDPALVVPTIAQALDIPVESDVAALDAVAEALAARELLLVLDNAEHVRDAAPSYAELVGRAPRVTLLVTSRAVLHVSGENVVPVVPLDENDAVELFAQRAGLLDTSFELTTQNEPDVREVCRQVDCLPLAVELAAARIRTLTPRALRKRLDARLSILTGGPRDLPARQQTLRETIAWSADLLDDRGRHVLARLAVFPAGATLDAAERMCDADLDTLAALVDDHLVRRDEVDGEPRFGMLETVREYALELLGKERQAVALAMAAYLADVAEAIEVEARTRAQALSTLDPEIDNIRAALDACAEAGAAELELRLAGGIWRYWWVRGSAKEGIARIERALAADEGSTSVARAQALRGAAGLAWVLGDFAKATELATAAIPVAVAVGSDWDEMAANTVLGVVANVEGDRARARRHHRRSMEISEQLGLEPFVQKLNLGTLALDDADYPEAQLMFDDVLAIHRRNENVEGIGTALLNLGVVHYALGEHDASLRAFEEARDCFEEVGFRAHVAHAVQGFAAFAASEGRFDDAARLLGEARGELDEIGAPEGDFASEMVAWTKDRAREALGEEAFESAFAGGRGGSV
ncbi:MAG TPA: BTAD domain-containing putative transcriptional regulator [Gaiellaceae bacterium]|nr:BTAD domain-containing putative transcriptional regulator [Gaiellaceae bacterium]